jgi:hypothetical protein
MRLFRRFQGEVRRITLLETVWKLRTGSICGLASVRDGVRDALFEALRHTDKRALRPAQLLSRQSL